MIDRISGFEGGAGAQQYDQIREQALEIAATARERLAHGAESVRRYTIEQPARALGLALGMGVFLGWLIKRR